MIIEAIAVGGVAYAGSLFKKKKMVDVLAKRSKQSSDKRYKSISSITEQHKIKEYADEIERKFIISGVSTLTAGAGFVSPLFSYLSAPGLIYSSTEIVATAYNSAVRHKKINIDFLITVMTILMVVKGYWFVANLNIFFAIYNRKLLLKIKGNSQNDIVDIFRQQPKFAWVISNGIEVEVPVDNLKHGDIVIVNAGATIPIDGQIRSGMASIDQHVLTGESQPAEKGVGETVFALTVVLSGRIEIEIVHTGEETTAAQIASILNQAGNQKTDRQLWVEKIGESMVLPSILVSGAFWPLLGASSAIGLLNCHPRYKTTIATYSGLLSFLSIASKHSILIKDGRVFERLHKVDTVVFDKTGTLTENKLHVEAVHCCEQQSESDILIYAALAEQRQKHPIAQAILHEAELRQLELPNIDQAEYRIGYGMIVYKDADVIKVGSMRFIQAEGIAVPETMLAAQQYCHDNGYSFILVAVNDCVVGGIELHATIREEVGRIIAGLRQRQIESIYIISGDQEMPTKNLAHHLGVDHYFSEVLPMNKADIIQQLQDEGKVVCFIGDGINDSIALKQADVSISLNGASTVATDTAQIILMNEGLTSLCDLFDLVVAYERNMKTTFAMVLGPHMLTVIGVLFFHFGLAYSVIINQAGLFLGMGNAILPRLRYREHEDEADNNVS